MDERTLNDLLECSVCLERLDTSSKVLPCQHTFCRKCLEVILSSRQELRCPECRILVETKIDYLPPNVLLMRILEGMKNTASARIQQVQEEQYSTKPQNENIIEKTQELNMELQKKLQKNPFSLYTQKEVHLQAYSDQQQQQRQPEQKNETPSVGANSAFVEAAAIHQQRFVPHAYALYDFKSNEPSDLHFKKGDIILLKRKVDINWFVGELNGVEGTFPANYVQIMVPLPSPQCVALYDFKMGPNEEEGCLTFKKGTRIHVLRRVDHNWAEGRIGSMIGIFPIAFVELNTLAKQLLDSFVVLNSPPPPPVSVSQNQHKTTSSLEVSGNQRSTASNKITLQPRNLPPVPSDMNTTTDKTSTSQLTQYSSSSPSRTSPNCNSNSVCSSSSSSLPCSPNQSHPTSPLNTGSVRYRDCREKRHSLNALLSSSGTSFFSASSGAPLLSIVQSNRHSAEILSIPSSDMSAAQDMRMCGGNDMSLASGTSQAAEASSFEEQHRKTLANTRANVLKTAAHQLVPPTLPWGYLALYPYKPRKNDELELKKGCVYIVTERCLDGWFRGKNWQDVTGVFPGNYLTPLRNRDQQQLMHQWKYIQNHAPVQQLSLSATQKKHPLGATCILLQPPELPPRSSPSASPVTASVSNNSSAWSKPLSHTVEALFTRKVHNTHNDQQEGGEKERDKQKDNNTSSSAPSAAVSLMKRLTHIKTRSKSPNNAALCIQKSTAASKSYVMDNPSFKDTSAAMGTENIGQSCGNVHPIHVRSGSCPSELLQNGLQSPSSDTETTPTSRAQHAQKTAPLDVYNTGSQNSGTGKERSLLPSSTRQPTEVIGRASTAHTKCSQQARQQQQQIGLGNSAFHHRKSQSLDANTMAAQSIPSNSKHTMDAGRAASSTAQNIRENRFRCVVSYPPNSDLELDLHVGDVVYVHRKQKNGWYKGTHARTHKTGLFPCSFVEPDI